ncbi:unnamed protein product [Timema podura]|uniref:Uncharacterized protein n=1 Tax=Timema podura TaxID=61482 RepID=A0ABN7NLP8_TIMPD|nr:unnamed protein product [Timema podura]
MQLHLFSCGGDSTLVLYVCSLAQVQEEMYRPVWKMLRDLQRLSELLALISWRAGSDSCRRDITWNASGQELVLEPIIFVVLEKSCDMLALST